MSSSTTPAYNLLVKDLYELLHNASVDAGCAARDLQLALKDKKKYDSIQTTGAVPVSDLRALMASGNQPIEVLTFLRNALEVETKALEAYWKMTEEGVRGEEI